MWRAAVLCLVFSCLGCVEEDDYGWGTCGANLGISMLSCPSFQPRIAVAPSPLSFGQVARGEAGTLMFQVLNTGDGALRVTGVEVIEGDEDGDREITPGQLWEPKFDIPVGGAPKTLSLEWRPLDAWRDTAKLRFKVVNAVNARDGVFEVDVTTPPVAR